MEQRTGPVVNGEAFAFGYTPEAAEYEQRMREHGTERETNGHRERWCARCLAWATVATRDRHTGQQITWVEWAGHLSHGPDE